MCGIAGIIFKNGRPVEKGDLETMASLMQERGPDNTGYHIDQSLGFVHTRLSIIDLNSHANQPLIKNEISLVFNGEIYNYVELRNQLKASGASFYTNSDTEVLLEGYKIWGINKLLGKCNGMFAFVINDKSENVTYIARDRYGQKPLYYAQLNEGFYFASDIRSIANLNKGQLNLDMESVEYFLTELSVPQPKSIWREIQQVKPAHYLELKDNTITEKLYWQIDYHEKAENYNLEEIIDITEEKLKTAILRRTVSDLPIGCFLSGGVDSGLITSILAQNSSDQIKTFSIGLDCNEQNELPDAKIVADRYNTDHHEIIAQVNAMDDLVDLVQYFGEPFADSSMIPSFIITKEIKKHVTVALSGDGGDEFWGGYWDYLHCWEAEELREKLSSTIDRNIAIPASKALNKLGIWKNNWGSLESYYNIPHHLKLYRSMGMSPYDKRNCYGQKLSKFNGFSEFHFDKTWNASYSVGLTDKFMESSLNTRLLNDYLVKVDRSSMNNSLEVRSPFLDHELTEWSFKVPTKNKFTDKQSKYILKRIAQRHVDPMIFNRKKKGFGIPLNKWLRKELKPLLNDTIYSQSFRERDFINHRGITELVNAQNEGADFLTDRVYAVLVLELWLKENT